MVRILHTADLHLNHGFTSGYLPYDKVKDRQGDLIKTFDGIMKMVRKERIELLLISGDLFEHRYIQNSTVEYVNHKLQELKDTKVFILPGNHDPYHLTHYYKSYPWGKNIYIFTDEYEEISLGTLNVVVHGIGFGYLEESRALLEELRCNQSDEIHILMLHGSDMSLAPRKESKYLPFNQEDLANSGFDYIALGHYHQHKVFYNDYKNVIAAYPGSPEPLGFDETGKHGVIVGDIRKGSNEIQFQSLSNREYHVLDIDITDCSNLESIKDRILQCISSLNPKDNLFSISISGGYKWELGESIELLEDTISEQAYYSRIKDSTLPSYDLESFVQEDSLLSSYILEIQNRMDMEKDQQKREILKKALDIGIEAFRGGRYRV